MRRLTRLFSDGRTSAIRGTVFWPAFLLLFAAMVFSFADLPRYLAVTTRMNDWILTHFSGLFSLSSFCLLMTACAVLCSPLGKVRIGGVDAKPLLSRWRWFAITLCTTIATGILLWSAAEPLYHLYSPPVSLDVLPNTTEARQFAMATMFMHWSFTPYAIFCVPALVFALCYYNLNKPFSIGASLSPLLGPRACGAGGQVIDAIALVALVAGMVASLGTGILVLGGGVESVSGIANSKTVMAAVAAAIVSTFVVSAVSGLHKGIARLSNFNLQVFLFFFVFVLVFGPTQAILSLGGEGVMSYVGSFMARSTNQLTAVGDDWPQSWTVFYWANWYAWAPVTALFLGRIARGYTVREFICVNLILPASCAMLWTATFSGATLHFDQALGGALREGMLAKGPESVVFALFEHLPLGAVMVVAFIGITFVSFVTAADSNTDVISNLCTRNDHPEGPDGTQRVLKYIWGISIGIFAWVMVSYASVEGIKMMSNLGGLPAMLVIILTNFSLLILLKRTLNGDTLEPAR